MSDAARDPDNPQQFYFHGSTPLPHALVDEWLHRVTAKRFLVLLFMWRKLVGYQKWRDFISLSQVARSAGVSVPTAIKELDFWERVGVFRRNGAPRQARDHRMGSSALQACWAHP